MYYIPELLTRRHRGSLAKCWLAATMTEKRFKQTCKPLTIKGISINDVCEQIVSILLMENRNANGRFSLYLSSQLMYGIARIFSYQISFFEVDLFEITIKLESYRERKRHDDEIQTAFEPPHIRNICEILENNLSTELHLIQEKSYNDSHRHMLDFNADVSFGMLPLEQFPEVCTDELDHNQTMSFRWNNVDAVAPIMEHGNITLPDLNNTELEKEEILQTEKEYLSPTRMRRKESIVDISDQLTLPRTPTKRNMEPAAETPKKRSRLQMTDDGHHQLEVPMLEQQRQQDISREQQLEEINEMQVEIGPPRRRRIIYDTRTQISSVRMRNAVLQTNAHTIPLSRTLPTLFKPTEYFQRPATMRTGPIWSRVLLNSYNYNLKTYVGIGNEFDYAGFEFVAEETMLGEAVRENVSRFGDYTAEISSKMVSTTLDYDPSKSQEPGFENLEMPNVPDVLPVLNEDSEAMKSDSTFLDLPNVTGINETLGQTGEKFSEMPERRTSAPSKSSCASSSRAELLIPDLLAMLEVEWCTKPVAKFHELISAENYNKSDASCALENLLVLHTEEQVVLKQAQPFSTIWIEKNEYSANSSSN